MSHQAPDYSQATCIHWYTFSMLAFGPENKLNAASQERNKRLRQSLKVYNFYENFVCWNFVLININAMVFSRSPCLINRIQIQPPKMYFLAFQIIQNFASECWGYTGRLIWIIVEGQWHIENQNFLQLRVSANKWSLRPSWLKAFLSRIQLLWEFMKECNGCPCDIWILLFSVAFGIFQIL